MEVKSSIRKYLHHSDLELSVARSSSVVSACSCSESGASGCRKRRIQGATATGSMGCELRELHSIHSVSSCIEGHAAAAPAAASKSQTPQSGAEGVNWEGGGGSVHLRRAAGEQLAGRRFPGVHRNAVGDSKHAQVVWVRQHVELRALWCSERVAFHMLERLKALESRAHQKVIARIAHGHRPGTTNMALWG